MIDGLTSGITVRRSKITHDVHAVHSIIFIENIPKFESYSRMGGS